MTPQIPRETSVGLAAQCGGVGLYEWNPATQVFWMDETLAAIFEARVGESPMQTWLRRVHPQDQRRVRETFSRFDQAEDLYRLVMDDGSIRHVLSRATYVVHDDDGAPSKVVGVMLDVTETQNAAARLASTLESISDGFLALDRDFRFTYVNAQAELLLGMRREQMLGSVLWDLFPAALGTPFEAVYKRVMATRVVEAFEAYYPAPLNMWVEVRAQPSAEGIVLYFQDVTARRAEQRSREKLLLAERSARQDAERARSEAEIAREAAEWAREEVAYQASHDGLTGLCNRTRFEELAQEHLSDAASAVTALFIDLDRFKIVNDSLGHAAGDALLVQVAERLREVVRQENIVARLGGDEFVVLLLGDDAKHAPTIAERLLEVVRRPIPVLGSVIRATASIGLARADEGATVQTLLRNADVALYRAKDAGRDQCAWFDSGAHEELLERLALEADLRVALDSGALELHYQPTYDLDTQRMIGVEALARWPHAIRGYVPPGKFIPLAEDVGLIPQLGEFVIGAACAQAARWRHRPDFVVWINVSGRQLERPGLAPYLLQQLTDHGVPAHRFGVEVTESVLMDEQTAAAELAVLAAAGVTVAIDDFGTGYSSLSRLTGLPIHVLKIDRSFVQAIGTPRGRVAVDVIVHLAHALGMRTVAEGVETSEQLALLREAGSDAAAGYLLGRPAPAKDLPLATPQVPLQRQVGGDVACIR